MLLYMKHFHIHSIIIRRFGVFDQQQISSTTFVLVVLVVVIEVPLFVVVAAALLLLALVDVIVAHNEELSDLYCSHNIVRVIKSRRMRWAGHVARIGEEGGVGSWWGNRRERDHWGDLGVDVWIILGWISRRWDVDMWTGLGWPRIGIGGGRL